MTNSRENEDQSPNINEVPLEESGSKNNSPSITEKGETKDKTDEKDEKEEEIKEIIQIEKKQEEEEGEEEEPFGKTLAKSIGLMLFGTFLVAFFSDPMGTKEN